MSLFLVIANAISKLLRDFGFSTQIGNPQMPTSQNINDIKAVFLSSSFIFKLHSFSNLEGTLKIKNEVHYSSCSLRARRGW